MRYQSGFLKSDPGFKEDPGCVGKSYNTDGVEYHNLSSNAPHEPACVGRVTNNAIYCKKGLSINSKCRNVEVGQNARELYLRFNVVLNSAR